MTPMREPPSILELLSLINPFELGMNPESRVLASNGTSYLPSYSPGTTEIILGDAIAAVAQVTAGSGGTSTEDVVMRDAPGSTGFAAYPPVAPRPPGLAPGGAFAHASASPFPSREAYRAGVLTAIGLAPGETATYARASIRRFRVVDPAALAASLTEAAPPSKRLTRMTGVDAQGAPQVGWVYVETATTRGMDTTVRQVHQLTPMGLLLPPDGAVQLSGQYNPSAWDLRAWILANAPVGTLYARCLGWYSIIGTQADVNLAGTPPLPDLPAGVEPWAV